MSIRLPFNRVPQSAIEKLMSVENYLSDLPEFDTRTLELMRIYVSNLNQCAYCVDMHYKEALAAGETPERLASILVWKGLPFYSDKERAILAWAEALTLQKPESEISQAFQTLTEHYSQENIANLTIAITQIDSWNHICKAFGWPGGHYEVGQH